MTTVKEVMDALEGMGSESTKKVFINHGCTAPFFGVKVADMKKILKHIKKNHALALELYDTGNADAQYLAGLATDSSQWTKKDLQHWANTASWHMVAEYSVAWNVAESGFCLELFEEWRNSENAVLQTIAWSSLSSYLLYEKREDIDPGYCEQLLQYVEQNIHQAENRVRYTMNGFVIALGGTEPAFFDRCQAAGKKIGKVEVMMGKTACKVPDIVPYLDNMKNRNRIGNRKKTVKC